MYDETVTISSNEKINEKYFKLSFHSKNLSKNVEPGQFLHMAIEASLDPFLRRPFSYYRVTGDKIEVLYEILGRGTKLLSNKREGDTLKIMGPLGKFFTQQVAKKKRVLIAGGVGVPPLVFLSEKFKVDYLLIGTKSRAEVMPESELSKVQAEILYSTNDGSYGKKGFVTSLLNDIIVKEGAENLYLQTCGPNVMMQAVMDIAAKHNIKGEASIDKPMACGIGACLGCMVKTPKGWIPSCTEGPIFKFNEIECI